MSTWSIVKWSDLFSTNTPFTFRNKTSSGKRRFKSFWLLAGESSQCISHVSFSVPTWGIQTALTIHITQSQDYPYAKNEYKLVIAIYCTRMTILIQEMNAIADSHLLHENRQEAERIRWIMILLVWGRSAGFCSPTPIPEQPKKQKKRLRNKGEREESFLVPKCQI